MSTPPKPLLSAQPSRLLPLLGLMLWTLNAFGELVVAQALSGVFRQFDAKLPLLTRLVMDYRGWSGAGCLLLAVAMLVRECRGSRWGRGWDWALLVSGLFVCAAVYVFLWLPMRPMPGSQMEGG